MRKTTKLLSSTLIAITLSIGLTSCRSSDPANPTPSPEVTIAPIPSHSADLSLFTRLSYKELLSVAASDDTETKLAVVGTVAKVIEKETSTSILTSILVSMNERDDQLFYCEFDQNLLSSSLSIGDKITVYGTYSHSNTMLMDDCSTASIPYIQLEYIY